MNTEIVDKLMDWDTGKTIRFDHINGLAKKEKL